jgi:hypothetical protein
MKKDNLHSGNSTTMKLDMNPTRAATMQKILADRPLLNHLDEKSREELIDLYIKNLEKWENR